MATHPGVALVTRAVVSVPGVHPRLNADHLQARMDDLGLEMLRLTGLVERGLLRRAGWAEVEACRDAVARLADALLGLGRAVDDLERPTP